MVIFLVVLSLLSLALRVFAPELMDPDSREHDVLLGCVVIGSAAAVSAVDWYAHAKRKA